jgi:hypothetical protein
MTPIIKTPRGQITVGANGKAQLVFNPNFAPKWTKQYSNAQRFVDSEVLRLSEPYTPLLTGTLIKTGILGTDVGSGLVQWIAPYAKSQYYSPRKAGSQTGTLRGPFWFARMKSTSGKDIIKGAKKIAGNG